MSAGWKILAEEISAGVYRVRVKSPLNGVQFEQSGPNPEELEKAAINYVEQILMPAVLKTQSPH